MCTCYVCTYNMKLLIVSYIFVQKNFVWFICVYGNIYILIRKEDEILLVITVNIVLYIAIGHTIIYCMYRYLLPRTSKYYVGYTLLFMGFVTNLKRFHDRCQNFLKIEFLVLLLLKNLHTYVIFMFNNIMLHLLYYHFF